MKNSELFAGLKPYIVELIRSTSLVAGAGTGTTGTGMQVHALDSSWHTGQLDPSQATWALSSYRTVAAGAGLTGGGNLTADISLDVAAGNGIEVAGDAVAVKLKTTSGLDLDANGLSAVTPATLTVATTNSLAAHTHAITSSANPGAAASLLATTSGGLLTLVQLTTTTKVRTPQIDTGSGYLSLMPFASRVGVNTDAPDYALDVVGTIQGQTAVRGPSLVATTALTTPSIVTASGNLTITPVGDLVLSPGGADVLPESTIVTDLGDYNRKWRTLYAAELYVETLIAQDVVSTIGGRIEVTPTTSLIAFLDNTATTIDVKHNNLRNGEYAYLMTAPAGVAKFEAIKVVSAASAITGGYRYTIERNKDGTGANDFDEGDAVASLGKNVGEGTISLTATSTILNHAGPTIAIYTRNATTAWNSLTPTVALGQLSSFAGYSGSAMGLAIGDDLALDPAAGVFKGLTADATNGVRLFNTPIKLFSGGAQTVNIDAAGTDVWIGSSGDKRLYWDGTDLRIGGSGTGAWYISANKISSSNIRLLSSATASSARIEVGTGTDEFTGGMRGTDGAETGVVFWTGATHANRNSAPFRVQLGGAFVATNATLTGSLTAGNVAINSTNAIKITATSIYDLNRSINWYVSTTQIGYINVYGTGASDGVMTLTTGASVFLNTANVTSTATTVAFADAAVEVLRIKASGATGYLRASDDSNRLSWTNTGVSVTGTFAVSSTSTLTGALTASGGVISATLRAASGTLGLGIGTTSYLSLTSTKLTTTVTQVGDDWANVPVESSSTIGNWVSGYQGRCKLFGDIVFMQGRFDPVNIVGTGTTQIIATVSSEFHPAREQGGSVLAHVSGGGYENAPIIIATDGTITLSLAASWRSHDWVDFSFLQWSVA
jgi:trimeric autotransporter adhesin